MVQPRFLLSGHLTICASPAAWLRLLFSKRLLMAATRGICESSARTTAGAEVEAFGRSSGAEKIDSESSGPESASTPRQSARRFFCSSAGAACRQARVADRRRHLHHRRDRTSVQSGIASRRGRRGLGSHRCQPAAGELQGSAIGRVADGGEHHLLWRYTEPVGRSSRRAAVDAGQEHRPCCGESKTGKSPKQEILGEKCLWAKR